MRRNARTLPLPGISWPGGLSVDRPAERIFAREEVKLDLIPIAGGTDKMIAALDQSTVDVTQTATPI